jgi:hypothetical protein
MKKILVFALAILTCAFLFKVSLAQDTEPPLGLPSAIIEDTESPTAIVTYTSPTATRTATITRTATTQEAVDDAEVGSEIVLLVTLSIIGGLGIFLIKKYFDLNRFRL